MKKTFNLLLLIIALTTGLISCENNGSIGGSVTESTIEVLKDSSFVVSGVSVPNTKIASRTLTQLLGAIEVSNFGELRSDIVAQFMPSFNLDTAGVTTADIDSVKLIFRIPLGGFVGDSVMPMRMNIYKLNKQLPTPIYSDFNPADYYSKNDLFGSVTYSASALGQKDSIAALKYREIKVNIAKSFGVDLFNEYKKNPNTFATPESFAKFFPGIFVTNSYGSGRVMSIDNTEMNIYYRKHVKTEVLDTIYKKVGTYLAVTPEVISNNNINLKVSKTIIDRIANHEAIIQAPTGYDISIPFPVKDIIAKYTSKDFLSIINELYFEIPASTIENDNKIGVPPYLLLIKTSEKDSFFQKNETTDNISSFYAVYDKTKKAYIFSNMRDYFLDILEKGGEVKDEDINMTLTPVAITTENSNTNSSGVIITKVAPYVASPVMAKLDFSKAKIRLTYSRQTLNN